MLAVHCPRHDSQVLLFASNIIRIDGQGPAMTVHWTCHCGHHGQTRPQQPVTVELVDRTPQLEAAC